MQHLVRPTVVLAGRDLEEDTSRILATSLGQAVQITRFVEDQPGYRGIGAVITAELVDYFEGPGAVRAGRQLEDCAALLGRVGAP